MQQGYIRHDSRSTRADTESELCAFLVLRRPVHFADLNVAKVFAGGTVVAATDIDVLIAAAAAAADGPDGDCWHYRTRLIFVSERTRILMALQSEIETEGVWQNLKCYYLFDNADLYYCFDH